MVRRVYLSLGAIVFAVGCAPREYHYPIPVKVFSDGHVGGAAELESVGGRMRNLNDIRIDPGTLAELDLWNRSALWVSDAPDRSCFRFIDYQGTGDDYADGHSSSSTHASYTGVKVALDTGSGAHYVAEPDVRVDNLSFRFDSLYSGENGYQSWVPATAYYEHSVVNACFSPTRPLAGEHTVSWSMTDSFKRWIMHFDFTIEGGGATLTSASQSPVPDPGADSAAPPAPPPSASITQQGVTGRYAGDVSTTVTLHTKPSTAPSSATRKGEVELVEDGDTITIKLDQDCALRARRKSPHASAATILPGQTCNLNGSGSEVRMRITRGQLSLSAGDLEVSYTADMTVTQHAGGKSATAPGTMQLTIKAHHR